MYALLIGHWVPTNTTTTALRSLKSARETSFPSTSFAVKAPTAAPALVAGTSFEKRQGTDRIANVQPTTRHTPSRWDIRQFLARSRGRGSHPARGEVGRGQAFLHPV